MSCQRCGSERVLSVSGKCADQCSARFKEAVRHDYAPYVTGVCGGDHVKLTICLECGQAQGKWPQPDPEEFEDA
jgi:hypothetical protein